MFIAQQEMIESQEKPLSSKTTAANERRIEIQPAEDDDGKLGVQLIKVKISKTINQIGDINLSLFS